MTAQMVQEPLAALVRGKTVVVGDTGEKMVIASKYCIYSHGKIINHNSQIIGGAAVTSLDYEIINFTVLKRN